jgi:hypothetical protein
MKSIKQAAIAQGVSDRTIRNWLDAARKDGKEVGRIRGNKLMFTDSELSELSSYGRQVDDEVIEPEFVVEEGNHRELKTLSVPNFSSLERFRTDRTRQTLANPREFVRDADGLLSELEQGMTLAEMQQEQELLLTRQTKRQVQQRIERFRRRSDEYRIKTDILASIQNAELDELDDLADEVGSLGKSQDAPKTSSNA